MLSLYVAVQTLKTSLVDRLDRDETGATAVEYGIMVALIAAVIVGVVATIGDSLLNAFNAVQAALAGAGW